MRIFKDCTYGHVDYPDLRLKVIGTVHKLGMVTCRVIDGDEYARINAKVTLPVDELKEV